MTDEQRIAFNQSDAALRDHPSESVRRAYAEYCASSVELDREYGGWLRRNGYKFAIGRQSQAHGHAVT